MLRTHISHSSSKNALQSKHQDMGENYHYGFVRCHFKDISKIAISKIWSESLKYIYE